ncbi:MAG: hypothetical protein RLZZ502_767 [Pseudomonadota bacterium]
MLGLFIILPVFALFAESLPGGGDPATVGFALGIYGLTQGLLQIPYGWMSDRFGRKPVLYFGLAVFAVGSFVAALSTTLTGIIIGRALQGAGAVSGVVMASVADVTREEVRARAMAIVGISIGLAFELSFVIGPLLDKWIGVAGLFAMTGVLVLMALAVVRFKLPLPTSLSSDRQVRLSDFAIALKHPRLWRLMWGSLALHAALTALFVVVPHLLRDHGIAREAQGWWYLAITLVALLLISPWLRQSQNEQLLWRRQPMSIAMFLLALILLSQAHLHFYVLLVALVVFFCAFNLLEISLPTLVSLASPAGIKGSVLGLYASLQFLGTFIGGAVGGLLAKNQGNSAVFWFCGALTLIWFIISINRLNNINNTDSHV